MQSEPVDIELIALTKRYGQAVAVDGIDLRALPTWPTPPRPLPMQPPRPLMTQPRRLKRLLTRPSRKPRSTEFQLHPERPPAALCGRFRFAGW